MFHSDTTPAERAFAGGFAASAKICTDDVFADGCDKDATTHAMREADCTNDIINSHTIPAQRTVSNRLRNHG